MTETIINISHEFEYALIDINGDFVTSEVVSYKIENSVTGATITSGNAVVQGDIYKFSYTFTSLVQFRVLITTPSPYENGIEVGQVVNSVEDRVWDAPIASHLGVGSTGEALDGADATADPSAIADAVWNEQAGDHVGVGSTGECLDTIKSKTNNLPNDPTSEANATTNTNDIITEINANEVKIDALDTKMQILLDCLNPNVVIDQQVYVVFQELTCMTSARKRIFPTSTDAINETNVLKTITVTAEYDIDGNLSLYREVEA